MASVAWVEMNTQTSNGLESTTAREATTIAVVDTCILILPPGFAGRMTYDTVGRGPLDHPGVRWILHLPRGSHLNIIPGRSLGKMDLALHLARIRRRVCETLANSDTSEG